MISRFFKKKQPKASQPKKESAPKKSEEKPSRKILTAAGWQRLMMRKFGKTKK